MKFLLTNLNDETDVEEIGSWVRGVQIYMSAQLAPPFLFFSFFG